MSESSVTRRLQHEIDRARTELVADLKFLAAEVANAMLAVNAGTRINAHIIANAAMISASIARWNLALELLPLTAENDRR
jgi:hypothetical protein